MSNDLHSVIYTLSKVECFVRLTKWNVNSSKVPVYFVSLILRRFDLRLKVFVLGFRFCLQMSRLFLV